MTEQLIITGIGTDVGKTVVSSIIVKALDATYWKPIQAGDLDNSDTIKVKNLTFTDKIIPEIFQLNSPMSPHAAARIDGVEITLEDINLPQIEDNLVIEGAGGVYVPINDHGFTYLDVFKKLKLPVIIVSRHYLGSINHSLLTINALKSSGLEIKGIVFVGDENLETERIITSISGCSFICRIPIAKELNNSFIAEEAKKFKVAYERINKER